MDAARTPQGNLFHLEAPAPDLVCVYSPGAFIGAALREQERYFAAYIPKILSLHPYREMMAKRLARYLRSDWRLNPEGYMPLGPRRYRTWNAHLASAGIHLDDRDHRDPKDFVKNLDRAMSTLYDKGIIGDWCEEMYHPDDQALPMPRFNWLPSFLGRRVHIPPPAEVIDDLERTAIKRAVRKEQMALAAAKPARGKGRKKSP